MYPQMISFLSMFGVCSIALAKPLSGMPQITIAAGEQFNRRGRDAFTGIADIVSMGGASSPLEPNSIKYGEPQGPRHDYEMREIRTSDDYNEAFSASASLQGGYGTFTGSASAKYLTESTLTSRSSLYMMSYDYQLGWVSLDMAMARLTARASRELQDNPQQFVRNYGKYFIAGYTLGCQSMARITVTSKNEYAKKKVDATASAKYGEIVSASSEFSKAVEKTKGFESIQTEIHNVGGSVPSRVDDLKDIGPKIVDAMDNGACSAETATVTRVRIMSWLDLRAVAEVNKTEEAEELLKPSPMAQQEHLDRFDVLHGRTSVLLKHAEKCHGNPYACITKQWDEPVEHRSSLFGQASSALRSFRDTLQSFDESTMGDGSSRQLLKLENELQSIIDLLLTPAEALSSFTFHFTGAVISQHDGWKSKGDATRFHDVKFTLDPNRMDLDDKIHGPTVELPHNGHGGCRHYGGKFYVYYQAGKLHVYQKWSHSCNVGHHTTGEQTFQPGGSKKGHSTWKATMHSCIRKSLHKHVHVGWTRT